MGGPFVGPMICNFMLSELSKDFFDSRQVAQCDVASKRTNNSEGVETLPFLISFGNKLMMKVSDGVEVVHAMKKLRDRLKEAGLILNRPESRVYNLAFKCHFDWLGYAYLTIPTSRPCLSKFTRSGWEGRANEATFLNCIADDGFTAIKADIKEKIRSSKHGRLLLALI